MSPTLGTDSHIIWAENGDDQVRCRIVSGRYRYRGPATLAARRASVPSGHLRVSAGLINEDQLLRVEMRLHGDPDVAPDGIRVNAIGPGLIRTPLNADIRANGYCGAVPASDADRPCRRAGRHCRPSDLPGVRPVGFRDRGADRRGWRVSDALTLPEGGGFAINPHHPPRRSTTEGLDLQLRERRASPTFPGFCRKTALLLEISLPLRIYMTHLHGAFRRA